MFNNNNFGNINAMARIHRNLRERTKTIKLPKEAHDIPDDRWSRKLTEWIPNTKILLKDRLQDG